MFGGGIGEGGGLPPLEKVQNSKAIVARINMEWDNGTGYQKAVLFDRKSYREFYKSEWGSGSLSIAIQIFGVGIISYVFSLLMDLGQDLTVMAGIVYVTMVTSVLTAGYAVAKDHVVEQFDQTVEHKGARIAVWLFRNITPYLIISLFIMLCVQLVTFISQ